MLASIAAGCGGGATAALPDAGDRPGPALVRIEVTPPSTRVPAGFTQQLVAIGVFSDSTTNDMTSRVTWRSNRDDTATVSADGVVTAVAAGTAAIIAQADTVTGTATLTITDAELTSIAVATSSPSLPKGLAQQLTATGTFTDHSSRDLTRDVTWTSSAPQFVLVSNQPGGQGLATAVAVGTAKITASVAGKAGEATVKVTDAVLASIGVSRIDNGLPKGVTFPFAATAFFTDQSFLDVTQQVLWATSAPDVAQVSNTAGSQGLVTAVSVGTTNITATLQNKSGSVMLEVTAAALTHLAIAPGAAGAAKGQVVQFTATGTFTDQSMRNLTEDVLWESSNVGVAPISNAAGSRGAATALALGKTTIRASTGSFFAVETTLEVGPAVPVALAVDPPDPQVPRGPLTQQFRANLIYTDGSSFDVTATWTSSSPVVAKVSNTDPFQGKVTVGEPGMAEIRAEYSTVFGVLKGSTTITVTDATLMSIAVSPAEGLCARGTTTQFQAIGTFSDQTTRNVTEDVVWNSSAPEVALILNTEGIRGDTHCNGKGIATISATRGEIHREAQLQVE